MVRVLSCPRSPNAPLRSSHWPCQGTPVLVFSQPGGSRDFLLTFGRVLAPGQPHPSPSLGWVLRPSSSLPTSDPIRSQGLTAGLALCPHCPRSGWVLRGPQVGAAVVLCLSRCPGSPLTWGPRPLVAAKEAQGQGQAGPGDTQGRVQQQVGAGQSLSTAPGSSLVSVCQRSIRLSLFFRQSNQCFRRSPLALMPRTTPPMKSLDFPMS